MVSYIDPPGVVYVEPESTQFFVHIYSNMSKITNMPTFGGFRNRRHFRQPNGVLLTQLIVRWKHHAIDLIIFEKTACFNIGSGAIISNLPLQIDRSMRPLLEIV